MGYKKMKLLNSFKEKVRNIPFLGDVLTLVWRIPKNTLLVIKTRWFYFKQNYFPDKKESIIITDNKSHGDVYINTECRGFFSIIWQIIDEISIRNDRDIEVILNNTVYNDSKEDNLWDYYFEPVSNKNKEKLSLSFNFRPYTNALFPFRKSNLLLFNKIIQDRIQIKKEILDESDSFFKNNFKNKKVVGVNIRHRAGLNALGDVAHLFKEASEADYFRKIDDLLLSGYEHVFLATDGEENFQRYKNKYGEKLLSYSKIRSSNNRRIFFYHSEKHGKIPADFTPREHGREVLVDCLLLSKCDYLIHCDSNVSTMAAFLNPNLISINIEFKHKFLLKIL